MRRQITELTKKLKVANTLYRARHYTEAKAEYNKIIANHPGHIVALNKLRKIALKRYDFDTALSLNEKIISLTTNLNAEHFLELSSVLCKLRRYDDALEAHAKAIELKPDSARVYHKLAHIYRVTLRYSEAAAAYQKALQLDPKYINSYYPYSAIQKFEIGDPILERVKGYLAHKHVKGSARVKLLYTCGKIHHDFGQYGEAFKCYKQANDYMAKKEPFDIRPHNEELAHLMSVCAKDEILPPSMLPKITHVPIFILGMSRSGKSLLERILNEHPDVCGAGEGEEWYSAIDEVCIPDIDDEWFGTTVKNMSDSQKVQLAERFMEITAEQCPRLPNIVHSMPFGYWYISLIFTAMPQAKVIYCRRDPLDNIWVSYCKYYQSKNGYSYKLQRLVDFYKSYTNIMAHWLHIYADRILTVNYEDVCGHPDSELQRVFNYCGLHPPDRLSFDISTEHIGISKPYKLYLQKYIEQLVMSNAKT